MMKFTYFVCVQLYINVNYVCSIYHYNCGGSHASDMLCLNGSLRGITNHV